LAEHCLKGLGEIYVQVPTFQLAGDGFCILKKTDVVMEIQVAHRPGAKELRYAGSIAQAAP
jgi:hypothetical protein